MFSRIQSLFRSSSSLLSSPAASSLSRKALPQGGGHGLLSASQLGRATTPALLTNKAFFASRAGPLSGRSYGFPRSGNPNGRAAILSSINESNASTGMPHFEVRVYDLEEAMEELYRSQPLGFVFPNEVPSPQIDGVPPPTEGMQCIKRTFQPSVLRRKRAHGFLSRLKTRDGQKVLQRRRKKQRARMGV